MEDGGDVSVETGLRPADKLQAVLDKHDQGDETDDVEEVFEPDDYDDFGDEV